MTVDTASHLDEASVRVSDGFLRTDDVFDGLAAETILKLETEYGNRDLIRALEYAGIAGPFKVTSPWELEDSAGVSRINASGYAAVLFGYRYPPLIDFVHRFLAEDDSVGLPQQSVTKWRAALEANLIRLVADVAPSHSDSKVFFSNSGSEAIETAIKFPRASRPNGTYFIHFTRAFHGKTAGALSLTQNEDSQGPFRPMALETLKVPFGDLEAFEQVVRRKGADNIIAVALEPIQGEAGLNIPSKEFLSGVDRICKKHGIIVIVDEIQSGMGRSGYWVPSVEWGGMDPDIFTFAKALGGGLVPVGATVARNALFSKMLGGLNCKIHSNTFGGNSLAMAVGLKSLEIIRDDELPERSRRLGEQGLERLKSLAERYPKLITDVRGFGMWFAIQFQPLVRPGVAFGQDEMVGEFTTFLTMMMLHQSGLHANLSLNANRILRLTPALTMPDELYNAMFDRIEQAAEAMGSAGALLRKSPPKSMMDLTRFALGLP